MFFRPIYQAKEVQFLALYALILFLFLFSVPQSPNMPESLVQLITHVVYLLITFGAVHYFKSRTELFFNVATYATLFSAIIILVSFLFLGLGHWQRVTIPIYENGFFVYFPNGYESSSDPNVLSYFIYLGSLIILFVKGVVGRWGVVYLIVVLAGMLTLSRSGFVAFFIATLFYFLTLCFYRVTSGKVRLGLFSFSIRVIFPILVLLLMLFIWMDWSYVSELISNRIYSEGSNSSRIERLVIAIDILVEDPFLLLMGHGLGFSRLTMDPHNYYLSTMIDTGIVSLVISLFVFIWPFLLLLRRRHSSNEVAFGISMIIFFLVISMFYWQIRTYYFIILILLILNYSQPAKATG